jgi:hypothetical protein
VSHALRRLVPLPDREASEAGIDLHRDRHRIGLAYGLLIFSFSARPL